MLGDLLQAVRNAETQVAEIILNAQKKVEQLRKDTDVEITKIKAEADSIVAKSLIKQQNEDTIIQETPPTITVSKDRIDKAIKYIISEFHKRYT